MQTDMERNQPMTGKQKKRTAGTAAALAVFAALAVGGASPVEAQARAGAQGWAAFLGCWTPQDAEAQEGLLCFADGADGVEMLTVLDGEIAYREPFRTDGRPYEVEQDGCTGAESAWFSDDRKRLYTLSDVSCEGEAARRTTGIISMPERGRWLDVRATETNGATMAWSRWYARASDRPLEEAGGPAAAGAGAAIFGAGAPVARTRSPIAVADVVDASRNVHSKAVAAWVAEVGQEFRNLDADDLLRLDEEDVEEEVIDVVVAVSFPGRFSLGDDAPNERADDGLRMRGPRGGLYGGYYGYDPYWGYEPYSFGYSPFWGSRYGYGYPRIGYYGGWYGGGYVPVVVDVNHRDEGGRVVAGKGYRRGGARDGDDDSFRPGRPIPGRPTPGSTVGGSTRGGQSPPARSGGSTGRKAKPRGGKGSK